MVSYHSGNQRFVYRVAAVIVNGERVLLQRAEQDNFWSLPGGKIKMNEDSPDALLREMREVLNSQVEIVRLQWVVENIFEDERGQHHNIGLHYLVHLPDNSRFLSGEQTYMGIQRSRHSQSMDCNSEERKLIFQWFQRDELELKRINLLPAFLQQRIVQLPDHIEHIVYRM